MKVLLKWAEYKSKILAMSTLSLEDKQNTPIQNPNIQVAVIQHRGDVMMC